MKNQHFKILGIAFLLGFSIISSAQKLKNQKIEVSYRQLPKKPLDNEFTTFNVNIGGRSYANGNSLLETKGTTLHALAKRINLAGFKKVEGNAHIRVNVKLSSMQILKSTIESRVAKTKTKEGKEVKTTYYKAVFSYKVPVRYTVYDNKGNLLKDGYDEGNGSYTSKEKTSYARALKEWKDIRNRKIMEQGEWSIQNSISAISTYLNGLYGYPVKKERDDLKVPKKNDSFMNAYTTAKLAFAKAPGNEDPTTLAADMKPAIDFWMDYDKYSAKDRKKKKLRYACLYNLSKVYFWMDDMDNAAKYAKEAIAIGWKDKFLTRFLKNIAGVKKSLETNGVKSRRFFIDLESATPPKTNAEIAAMEEEEALNTNMDGKLILNDGTAITGEFKVKTEEGATLNFGPKGNINFVADGQERPLNPADIKSFSFNSRSFMVMDFAPGAKGNKKVGKHILELIYDSPRIKLFKYYPYDNPLGDKKGEFAFMKEGESAATSTSSSAFLLFKKGLAKYFSDCADLAELAGSGEIAHTEEGLMQAARIYGEVCE